MVDDDQEPGIDLEEEDEGYVEVMGKSSTRLKKSKQSFSNKMSKSKKDDKKKITG